MPDFSEGNFGHKQFQNVRLLNGQTAFNYKVKVLFFLQVFVGTTSNKCFAFFSGKGGGGFGIVTLCQGPSQERKSVEEELMRMMFVLQDVGHF